jgi:hypothetical protein
MASRHGPLEGLVNYYEVLGIADERAPVSAIRAAYLKLARVTHPDSTGGDDRAGFQLVSEAYTVLSDVALRAKHDADLSQRGDVQNAPHTPPQSAQHHRGAQAGGGGGAGPRFGNFGGLHPTLFQPFFGGPAFADPHAAVFPWPVGCGPGLGFAPHPLFLGRDWPCTYGFPSPDWPGNGFPSPYLAPWQPVGLAGAPPWPASSQQQGAASGPRTGAQLGTSSSRACTISGGVRRTVTVVSHTRPDGRVETVREEVVERAGPGGWERVEPGAEIWPPNTQLPIGRF